MHAVVYRGIRVRPSRRIFEALSPDSSFSNTHSHIFCFSSLSPASPADDETLVKACTDLVLVNLSPNELSSAEQKLFTRYSVTAVVLDGCESHRWNISDENPVDSLQASGDWSWCHERE